MRLSHQQYMLQHHMSHHCLSECSTTDTVLEAKLHALHCSNSLKVEPEC
jgi:hypothetical protein